jgi:Arc/MetJ family transcription regulator
MKSSWPCAQREQPSLVGYTVAMRLHITLDDDLVAELDRRVGARRRSGYIAAAVRRALSDAHRWELVESSIGAIGNTGHAWDRDPGHWVRAQRRASSRRVG